ncbi:HAMP domain-containing sensor histidine kinase [Sanguibacter sp. 4.1]|uniref:Sensor-like histidine kinase SenX3 n=1 Tax=Sanguibacter biliveldensis TaxID=3030830 RepID=A0AAF0Z5X3_9MICO|nr:HAMP domain-containing sensor histidine kinase [Sanguibacter sp. 4.1]WPF82644.1 HAMP domain-containing sensor histidine kinase [Sanguibacter sp. 4.1]
MTGSVHRGARGRAGSPWASPWVIVPVAVGLVVAAVLVAAGNPSGLRFTVPLATAVAAAGVGAGIVALLVLLLRRAVRRAGEVGAASARQEEKAAHHRFLARLDHELKNPLTAIHAAAASVSSTSLADGSGPGSPGGTGAVHLSPVAVIDAQAARMGRLVGDLRKISSLDSQEIEQEPVDVADLTAEVVAALHEELAVTRPARAGTVPGALSDVSVAFPRVPWPLPPVRGDVDLLFVALYNIVSNAVKFSADGAPIEVRGFEEEGAVVVEVADSGAGIPADELSLVWDELARGSNTLGVPGSGLGLATVHAIVRRHGGQAMLTSRLGHGTSVRLRLPTAQPG